MKVKKVQSCTWEGTSPSICTIRTKQLGSSFEKELGDPGVLQAEHEPPTCTWSKEC